MIVSIVTAVIALALLAVHILVSAEFYRVSVMKGWPEKKYLVMAIFLWVIGYMLIIALPDRGGYGRKAVESDDLPDI